MEFIGKKLPLEKASEMRVCPVGSVRPFVPLPAPLYILLLGNEKFLAVKGPLDFLAPAELERFRSVENFFYPPFIREVLPFREAGRALGRVLVAAASGSGVRPAPFEISDAFLRLTARLWSPDVRVEPFFISVFVTELCGPLPSTVAVQAREADLARYEQAVLKSAWAVWQALHLGYLDVDRIRALRDGVFGAVALGTEFRPPAAVEGLRPILLGGDLPLRGMALQEFSEGAASLKLEARAGRLARDLVTANHAAPSIGGSSGFHPEVAA